MKSSRDRDKSALICLALVVLFLCIATICISIGMLLDHVARDMERPQSPLNWKTNHNPIDVRVKLIEVKVSVIWSLNLDLGCRQDSRESRSWPLPRLLPIHLQ